MRMFSEVARQPKSMLEAPKASHGIAYAVNSRDYHNQVLKTFNQALT